MDERGHVTVMILGFLVVLMGVLGIALDGTKAFIHRRTLQNAADAAALAAAGELNVRAYYVSGGETVKLDLDGARERASEWLSARGITAVAHISVDRGTVAIVLRDSVPSGFLRIVGVQGIPVAVEAVAEPLPGAPR